MNLVTQPKRSRLCGQACIAMILGIPLDEAVKLIGHRKGTTTHDLRATLEPRGFIVGPPMLTRYHEMPSNVLAIARASKGQRRNWHWMVVHEGTVFDPASRSTLDAGFQITSYMRIVQCKIP